MSVRLFVAIEVPEPIRQALLALQRPLTGARWVKGEHLHLTLRFIGQVEADVGARIRDALAQVTHPRLMLTIGGGGVFPSPRAPRVLWAGADGGAPLTEIKKRIDATIEVPDREADRAFRPHVTLARLRDVDRAAVQGVLQEVDRLKFDPFEVDHFVLFRSEGGPGGSVYPVERSYPL